MKTIIDSFKRGFVLLLLCALAPTAVWAFPPRQHSTTGIIKNIDFANRSVTLKEDKAWVARTFVWNDSTRFRMRGASLQAEALQAGDTVRLSYRREVGRMVLREVSLKRVAERCCGACQ